MTSGAGREYTAGMEAPLLYLDHNATTSVSPEVREAMMPYLGEEGFNPSSPYRPAQSVRAAVDRARGEVSDLFRCAPEEITFTGCATESCNIAILGTALHAAPGSHVITVSTEHHAGLNAAKAAQRHGSDVTILPVNRRGLIDLDEMRSAFRTDTILVSVMTANNEIGVLQDVSAIGRMCRERGVLFHCDATAAIGKMPVRPHDIPCDFLSLSGHKFRAPKGVGALFVRQGVKAYPITYGGEQEEGLRPGTENVASIVGLGVASRIARTFIERGGPARLAAVRDAMESGIRRRVPEAEILSSADCSRVCNVLSVRVPGVRNDEMVLCLDREGICVSTGAACSTGASLPSHVIRAMGYSDDEAREVVRVSLGEENSPDDVERFASAFASAASRLSGGAYLRARAPIP